MNEICIEKDKNIEDNKEIKHEKTKMIEKEEVKETLEKEEMKKLSKSKINDDGDGDMNVKDVILKGVKEAFNDEVQLVIKEEVGKAFAEVKKTYEINREKEKEK